MIDLYYCTKLYYAMILAFLSLNSVRGREEVVFKAPYECGMSKMCDGEGLLQES